MLEIRTFDLDDFEKYSTAKLAKIRDEIGGNIEGDIPGATLGRNGEIRFIFQDNYHQNVLPDNPPQIVIKEYRNVSVLPEDDSAYEYEAKKDVDNNGKIREVSDILAEDSNGYSYIFDNSFGEAAASGMVVCLIELYYSIEGHEYVSTTALSL